MENVLKEIIMEFVNYERRICSICHEKVPKNTGYISYGAFEICHEKCLFGDKLNEVPVTI